MKRILLVLLLTSAIIPSFAQIDSVTPPYLRFPTFPPINLVLPDSSQFDKEDLDNKNAVMLMLFSPQCEHCKHETEDIIRNIDKFKKITIVMATTMPFDSMKAFAVKYSLANYKNIIVGREKQYFLPVFFNIRNLPFLAFYNRKRELISAFAGSLPIDKILLEFEK